MTPEQRLERYATFFRFEQEEDIDVNKLAEQWGVEARGIAGMISGAKSSEKLYQDLRRLGYEDDEFPDWWWSPARDQSVEDVSKSVEDTSKVVSSSSDVSGREQDVRLTPQRPRTPAPIEPIPGRPLLQGQDSTEQGETRPDTSGLEETPQDTSGLNQNEINLLGSQGARAARVLSFTKYNYVSEYCYG